MFRLKNFYLFLEKTKEFFHKNDFLEVYPPPLVQNPGMETHIHPFKVENTDFYLATSPEFNIKKLLTDKEFTSIYSLSYSFRNEPLSPIHRPQFLMLEFYSKHSSHYTYIQSLCYDLVCLASSFQGVEKPLFVKKTMAEIFNEVLQKDLKTLLSLDSIHTYIKESHSNIYNEKFSWEDAFFSLFLNIIEPYLKNFPFIIIDEFPKELAALSQVKNDHYAYRFEVYAYGLEIANGFLELQDLEEHKKRFNKQNNEKKVLYNYSLPTPDDFYKTLEKGLPSCTGVAVGIERLYFSIKQEDHVFFE